MGCCGKSKQIGKQSERTIVEQAFNFKYLENKTQYLVKKKVLM
jgi:hypothetical protein